MNQFRIEIKFSKPGIHLAALAHIVGWVKRDVAIIYVGFTYINASQKYEIATKLANPTRLVQTVGLTQPTVSQVRFQLFG
jgi:N-acetyl-beta-hexosaminidase